MNAEQIAALKVGTVLERSMIGNGHWVRTEVTEITARGVDVQGSPYVCFYTKLGDDGSTISGSLKASRHESDSRYYRFPQEVQA